MAVMYSVYVGRYETPGVSKHELQKLNKMGLKGYLFSRGDHYALKVFSTIEKQSAEGFARKLGQAGLVTEIEELDLSKLNRR